MEIVVFLVILSVLVLIHEAGHFVAAKMFGIRVEEFGLGLPPRALKLFRRGGTDFTLNWLPIGGFVKLAGEDFSAEENPLQKDLFFVKPIWQRAIVLTAGVVMNFVLGVVLFASVYSYIGIPTKTDRVKIEEVSAGSPAEVVGLKIGDRITKIRIYEDMNLRSQDINVENVDQFVKLVGMNKGKEIDLLVVSESGGEREVKVTPRENPPAGQGALGVLLTSVELVHYPAWQMPFRGAVVGLREAVAWGQEIATGMWQMVSKLVRGQVPQDVSGPVGIYQVSAQVSKHGLIPVLQFMGVLSINLAILNIMPLPALDGGRVVFLGIEKIIGKKRKNKFEGVVHTVGMIVLLSLMALITLRDVLKLLGKIS